MGFLQGWQSGFLSALSPEIWEDGSQDGIHDQGNHKVIAEHAIMDETYGREPARPDRVSSGRLARARIGEPLQCDLGRFDRYKDQEHDRREEVGDED